MPEKARNLGNSHLDLTHISLVAQPGRDLGVIGALEEQLDGLNKVQAGLLNAVALAGDVELRAERDEALPFTLENASQNAGALHGGG